ncbi:MAG TPA: hypothetical protein VIK71_02460 [Flavobacteriales bacterium]
MAKALTGLKSQENYILKEKSGPDKCVAFQIGVKFLTAVERNEKLNLEKEL